MVEIEHELVCENEFNSNSNCLIITTVLEIKCMPLAFLFIHEVLILSC